MQDKISQYIQKQFPEFYQEEGPQFIAFVKAYYEWLELESNTTYKTRHLLEWSDVDKTLDDFVLYFKEKYLKNIQFNTESNKKLLIKNATDLYRSKGTERSIDLFFKLVFGVEAEVEYPAERLFKLSDGDWETPKYLEVTYSLENINYVGKQIVGSISGATAFVEKYIRRRAGFGVVNLLYISTTAGEFIKGEDVGIVVSGQPVYTTKSARVIGSVNSVTIIDKSSNFSVGDIVSFEDSERGIGGLARVTSTGEDTGIVDFILLEGGWGFSLQSNSIVSEKVLIANNIVGDFTLMDSIVQPIVEIDFTGATETLTLGDVVKTYDGSNNIANGVIIEVDQNTGSSNGTISVSYFSGPFTTGTYYINSNTSSFTGAAVRDATIRSKLMNYPRRYELTLANSEGFFLDQEVSSNSDAFGTITDITGNIATVKAKFGQFVNGYSFGNTIITNVSTRLGIYDIKKYTKTINISSANTPSAWLTSPNAYQIGVGANTTANTKVVTSSVSGNNATITTLQMKGNWYPYFSIVSQNEESDGVFTMSESIVGGDYIEHPSAYWLAETSNTPFNVARISDGSGASFDVSQISETEQVNINTDLLAANTVNRYVNTADFKILTLGANASSLGIRTGDIVVQDRGWSIDPSANFNPTTGNWTCNTGSGIMQTGTIVTYEVAAGNTAINGLDTDAWYTVKVVNSTVMQLTLPETNSELIVNSFNIPNLGNNIVSESGHIIRLRHYGTVQSIDSANDITLTNMWPIGGASIGAPSQPFFDTANAFPTSNLYLASNTSKNAAVVSISAGVVSNTQPLPIQRQKDIILRSRRLGFRKSYTTSTQRSPIIDNLTYVTGNIGTVAAISSVDPGSDYDIAPEVLIIEEGIQALDRHNYIMELSNKTSSFVVDEKVSQTLANATVYTYQVNYGIANTYPESGKRYLVVAGDAGDISNTDDFIFAVSEKLNFNSSIDIKANSGFIAVNTTAVVDDLVRYTTEGSNTAILANNTIWRVQSTNSSGIVLANASSNATAIFTQPNAESFNPNLISNNFISIASNPFANDVIVRYVADTGNTTVLGLANNTNYYVVESNSTVLRLSNTSGGSPVAISNGLSETGHALILNNPNANGHNLYVYHNEAFTGAFRYSTTTGNTAIGGLTNGAVYYVSNPNTSGFKLRSTTTGSPIDISSVSGNSTVTSGHEFVYFGEPFPVGGLIISNTNNGSVQIIATYSNGANMFVVANNKIGTISNNDAIQTASVNPILYGNIIGINLEEIIVTAKGIVKSSNNTHITVKRIQVDDLWDTTASISGETSGATANIVVITPESNTYQIGINASLEANVITAEGQIASLDIIDSGFGYTNNEIIQFVSSDGLRSGTVKTNLGGVGIGKGYYRSSKGFLSDDFYIQDGDYYQEYSYEVFTKLSVDRYSEMFKKVMHTAGTKFFGSVKLTEEGNTAIEIAQSTIVQE